LQLIPYKQFIGRSGLESETQRKDKNYDVDQSLHHRPHLNYPFP
jgi:hypothetical protein